MCPSAPPGKETLLLGRFTEEGNLAFAAKPLRVTEAFLAAAAEGGDIGKRFRFTAPCLQHRCSRWRDGVCAVGEAAVRVAGEFGEPTSLPACYIRPQCRWFEQQGAPACRACPHIVHDMSEG